MTSENMQLIKSLQSYGRVIDQLSISWETKIVNNIDVLVPKVEVSYL